MSACVLDGTVSSLPKELKVYMAPTKSLTLVAFELKCLSQATWVKGEMMSLSTHAHLQYR